MSDTVGATLEGLLRGDEAAAPRTLVQILQSTVRQHPDEPALDDGHTVLNYRELLERVDALAHRLRDTGVGPGVRVGVRMASGTTDLYLSILAVLVAGGAYVPVDLDDPVERATLVFGEAGVSAVLTDGDGSGGGPVIEAVGPRGTDREGGEPAPDDDAWVIFTSGSTGVPKGVAVAHRSAAAFVDAEAQMFLAGGHLDPLGPGDRVLAGLSVAFDASCEEMWLAWRSGGCLVPAPRSLVRSGMDLGPWLVARRITVVSTVPTLAGLWPPDALDQVRLLIFGGEACPAALAERVVGPGREVWNTYGPTEATVVACGALLTGEGPVRIGLPLAGWDLAVVDENGDPASEGATGELVIGGVGLARYLDPAKNAERFAPLPSLGWDRAYRSGDLVVADPAGLIFVGRADDQVKLGGRRIELGEIDAALLELPGVSHAAAAVKLTSAGHQVLVGYLVADGAEERGPGGEPAPPSVGAALDLSAAAARLRQTLPAAMVPLLTTCDEIPVRTSGKVDRAALPWPLVGHDEESAAALHGAAGELAERWMAVLGARVKSLDDDFFEMGGGSLAAAQLVSGLRVEHPQVTVADIYAYPRLGAMVARLEELHAVGSAEDRPWVRRTPRPTQGLQLVLSVALQTVIGLRWAVWTFTLTGVLASTGRQWAPTISWWWVAAGWLLLITPAGRMATAAAGARLLLRGVGPGTYPRGGSVHVRLWAAEQLAAAAGAANLAGAPWISYYARALGATVGPGADLHALPPVTGLLTLGAGASVEPEVDLAGYWLDGDELRVGSVVIGPGATVGTRSTLLPGTRIGRDAEVVAGSAVGGKVPAAERWSGSPARRVSKAKATWPSEPPPRAKRWVLAYGVASVAMSCIPMLAAAVGVLVLGWVVGSAGTLGEAVVGALVAAPLAAAAGFVTLAATTLLAVRLLGIGVREGTYPVHSRTGWQVWATERLLDSARELLFPLYASLATPAWLRGLGAKVGKGVEASTVLLLPRMTTIGSGAFIADDTMIAGYELGGGGWMRIAPAKVGKRAFLGNSGMAAGGRTVPKNGLVAVLSAAPRKSKAGTSWLGSPPVKLRRTVVEGQDRRTFSPPRALVVARAGVELCRFVPVAFSVILAVAVMSTLAVAAERWNPMVAAALSGPVMLVAGLVAASATTAAKWLIVGRIHEGSHQLWSSFVWRNEVVDTFVEAVAAPWFANAAAGTPVLAAWLRSLGADVGRGVWCESYWLPEADLVTLGDGVSVNRGCVLQTHLFHDRVMSTGTVHLDHGATMGPHGVILPAASVGADATVGPASLVMRGEHVPARSRWAGNPIAPWPSGRGSS